VGNRGEGKEGSGGGADWSMQSGERREGEYEISRRDPVGNLISS